MKCETIGLKCTIGHELQGGSRLWKIIKKYLKVKIKKIKLYTYFVIS